MKKLFILSFITLFFTCQVENIVYLNPIMITDEPENVLTTSAILGGQALGEGGKEITEYGIVWSTSFPPTIDDNKIIVGNRLGSFSDVYDIFQPSTTYYYSVYGINEAGVGYGDIYEFTTTDEAPCNPQENYLDVESNISSLQDGVYENILVIQDSPTFYGGDYTIQANKGYISDYVEINIHFDGDFENLLSGMYPTVANLDFSNQITNKSVVIVRHASTNFTVAEENTVYVDKQNDSVIITLCDFHFQGITPYGVELSFNINTSFTVQ